MVFIERQRLYTEAEYDIGTHNIHMQGLDAVLHLRCEALCRGLENLFLLGTVSAEWNIF